ncbi:MAG: DUF262 domain-containing protein [Akkermansia sp.]|nr:DUF262 domain-containing protein [Akkermansia sp.]
MKEKYSVEHKTLDTIIGYINSGEIAIPEIQRPFVWKASQVRDLIDSMYRGYPAGYLIISQSPDMKLKDGTQSVGKKIMIDGQQRVTALMTAIAGQHVLDKDFKKKRIIISFNPLADEDSEEEIFKVQDNAIRKDSKWIADIADVFSSKFSIWSFVPQYLLNNPDVAPDKVGKAIERLQKIRNRQLGVIVLEKDLTIDEVTEIFVRINSKGAELNQADFVMSKIAANTSYNGNMLRKAIDYFSHLAIDPKWYEEMTKDTEFMESEFAAKLDWLKNDQGDIFDPKYGDILRIAFMHQFHRAKMKDLVSLLGGRNFETREYEEAIAEESFRKLTEGVKIFMNKYSFNEFVSAIEFAGFNQKRLNNSQMTLTFGYTLYLMLHDDPNIPKEKIKFYVAKWYVLSTLTGRYTGSPETAMEADIRRIREKGFIEVLAETEAAELSEAFWTAGLVQKLETSAAMSPFLNVFLAAQICKADSALFTHMFKVSDLIRMQGEVHHIFPKKYLAKHGITDKSKYNQIANYTYLDSQVNKAISDDAPCEYFTKALEAAKRGEAVYGNISCEEELLNNMAQNCIPANITEMDYSHYDEFLATRRRLMAQKIRDYYYSLG